VWAPRQNRLRIGAALQLGAISLRRHGPALGLRRLGLLSLGVPVIGFAAIGLGAFGKAS
jgi:hypothetical protein